MNIEQAATESIEALHWVSDHIPRSILVPTVWNSLESSLRGEPDYLHVRVLLLEEFTLAQVNSSTLQIQDVIAAIRAELVWRNRVATEYRALELDWAKDGRSGVMRALSKKFEGREMRRVFGALRSLGIAEERKTWEPRNKASPLGEDPCERS